MGTPPCTELEVEMALERVEGELAVELPAHMRAFARAYADDRPPPPAPPLARASSTLELARNACAHPLLADRGLALLRLVAPIVIDDDPAVAAARGEKPTWDGLRRLTEARDRVARAKLGRASIELVHALHGVSSPRTLDAPGPRLDAWYAVDGALDIREILDVWSSLETSTGLTGTVRVERSEKAHPRTFVIEPKREVVVIVPAKLDTPAARFGVLHELGHAVVALSMRPGVPRTVDEAAASYIARLLEPPSWLPPKWPTDVASAARARRLALASLLDRIERRLPEVTEMPSATPPWALWFDPGAQASYVEAEAIADRLRADLGPSPPHGAFVRALIAERDRVDQQIRL